jgi:hypothetical protein
MKGRKKREAGGVNEAEADLKDKPTDRNAPNNVAKEAEEMKKGGRAKKARGGKMEHKVDGEKSKMHAGRKPRKSGGRTGSDSSPFTSARKGTMPSGHKTESVSE